jgi:hypothetical protein
MGPPDKVRPPAVGSGGREDKRRGWLAGGTSVCTLPRPADETDDRPHCDAAGIYCAAFTIEQLQAFGRARVCCRTYYDTDEVA